MASLTRAIAELVRVEVDARVRTALADRPAVPELLSTAEAAQYARVSPRSIRRWLDQGKLRALRAGRELRIRRVDLDQLMRCGRRRSAGLTPEQLAARDFG
jgi:excisionase family DNA binding protein